jgi:hypothetical protein
MVLDKLNQKLREGFRINYHSAKFNQSAITFLLQSELHRCKAAAFLDKEVIQD